MRKGNEEIENQNLGNLIKLHRTLNGKSQKELAIAIGVSIQQIQKYEKGIDRVSAVRLNKIAEYLTVPITKFYNHLVSDLKVDINDKYFQELSLIKSFQSIKDINIKRTIIEFMKGISQVY